MFEFLDDLDPVSFMDQNNNSTSNNDGKPPSGRTKFSLNLPTAATSNNNTSARDPLSTGSGRKYTDVTSAQNAPVRSSPYASVSRTSPMVSSRSNPGQSTMTSAQKRAMIEKLEEINLVRQLRQE